MRTRNAHKHTHTVWASTLDTKRPPAPPDLGVREIATFRGKAETAIQFFVFGKFRTGRAIFFRQPPNSLSVLFGFGNCPYGRVGIFFLEAISPWWSRSQNHRIFLFQTFPGTQSGESGMFPYHFVEMVLGWRASFPFPNSKLVAVRKFKKSEKGRCHKRDHKRAVPKFKKVYLTKKLPGKNYPWCKVFRPEKPCRKNYPTCKLFHIPY